MTLNNSETEVLINHMECVFHLFIPTFQASATQFSAEDPDEPEAARDDRQKDVEDEVTESVLTIVSHDSFS